MVHLSLMNMTKECDVDIFVRQKRAFHQFVLAKLRVPLAKIIVAYSHLQHDTMIGYLKSELFKG